MTAAWAVVPAGAKVCWCGIATAVEFDSTVTRTGNCTVFGHVCWTCFQSCVSQSEL